MREVTTGDEEEALDGRSLVTMMMTTMKMVVVAVLMVTMKPMMSVSSLF